MRISARIRSSRGQNDVTLATNSQAHSIQIAPKATGFGSTANGGELLFLALATCYCNDIYREAAKRAIGVTQVEIKVTVSSVQKVNRPATLATPQRSGQTRQTKPSES